MRAAVLLVPLLLLAACKDEPRLLLGCRHREIRRRRRGRIGRLATRGQAV